MNLEEAYIQILLLISNRLNHSFTVIKSSRPNYFFLNEEYIFSNLLCSKCNYEFILYLNKVNDNFTLFKDNIFYLFKAVKTDEMSNISCNECIIKDLIE